MLTYELVLENSIYRKGDFGKKSGRDLMYRILYKGNEVGFIWRHLPENKYGNIVVWLANPYNPKDLCRFIGETTTENSAKRIATNSWKRMTAYTKSLISGDQQTDAQFDKLEDSKLVYFQKNVELGRAIARLYCAAQGVSLDASNKACELMDNANAPMRWGFDAEMSMSPYNVRSAKPGESNGN